MRIIGLVSDTHDGLHPNALAALRGVDLLLHAEVIVFGHTQEPLLTRAARRIIVNPGSAGPARDGLVPSIARLCIDGRQADAQLVSLALEDDVLLDDALERSWQDRPMA